MMAMQFVLTFMAVLMLAIFAGVVNVYAVDVVEYRESLNSAHDTVLKMIGETERDSWNADPSVDDPSVVRLRQLLPVTQRVRSEYGPVDVSNQWLHTKLDQYVAEEYTSKQYSILIDIEERLSAIMWNIDETVSATTSDTSKDQAKQKLSEILSREEFQKPSEKKQSAFEKWIADFFDWLAGLFPKSQIGPSLDGSPNIAFWLQAAVLLLAGILVIFGIYKLAPLLFPALRGKGKIEIEDRVILGETIEAGRSSDDMFAEAERLASDGDLRGAIRKGYIALIFDLSNKKQIGLARHKTNRDYLNDVRKKPDLYRDMKTLTGVYESHWYGSAESDRSVWSTFKKMCMEAAGRS